MTRKIEETKSDVALVRALIVVSLTLLKPYAGCLHLTFHFHHHHHEKYKPRRRTVL